MTITKHVGYTLLLCGCFFGCAEDAMLDYGYVEPKLVVQSRLTPDTTFTVQVTSTLIPTDHSEYSVPEEVGITLVDLNTGAVINLYRENNLFVAPQSYPMTGHAYKLFVVAPGFPAVEAVTEIPDPVGLGAGEILNLRLLPSEFTEEKMNVSYELRLNFEPHDHQFFHFSFLQTTTINVGTASEPDLREQAYFIEPQFPNEDGFHQHHETGVLIDASKLAHARTLIFSFVDYTLGDIEELGNLFIEVRTLTPEYYHYFTSLSRQLISREDPFAEPIPVYNNVQGGTGNFSGYSSRYYPIQIIP